MSAPTLAAVSGNEIRVGRVGRPAVHTSSAARKQAFRAKFHRLDLTIKTETGAVLVDIAAGLDCSQSELVNNMIRFALTNRNWRVLGLMGKKS